MGAAMKDGRCHVCAHPSFGMTPTQESGIFRVTQPSLNTYWQSARQSQKKMSCEEALGQHKFTVLFRSVVSLPS